MGNKGLLHIYVHYNYIPIATDLFLIVTGNRTFIKLESVFQRSVTTVVHTSMYIKKRIETRKTDLNVGKAALVNDTTYKTGSVWDNLFSRLIRTVHINSPEHYEKQAIKHVTETTASLFKNTQWAAFVNLFQPHWVVLLTLC